MVPVLDKNKIPSIPCSEKRVRKLMRKGEAKSSWYKDIFCIILQKELFNREKQDINGIDSGNKQTRKISVTDIEVKLSISLNTTSWIKDLLRVLTVLSKVLPLTDVVFENIYAKTIKSRNKWILLEYHKYSKCFVDDSSKGRLSLHNIVDRKRLSRNAKKEDCKILAKQI